MENNQKSEEIRKKRQILEMKMQKVRAYLIQNIWFGRVK